MGIQNVINVVLPRQCLTCDALVGDTGALCSSCWAETPFLGRPACNLCNQPVLGDHDSDDIVCDTCLATPRPWTAGRAVLEYRANARKIVLSLKHGGRMHIAKPAAHWMAARVRSLVRPSTVAVPVPLHWRRLLRRRFNQSAALAGPVARELGVPFLPDALIRRRSTRAQEAMTVEERFSNMADAIVTHPRRGSALVGKDVLLIDDVMTSGATFAAASIAALNAGASSVQVLALARVVKDG